MFISDHLVMDRILQMVELSGGAVKGASAIIAPPQGQRLKWLFFDKKSYLVTRVETPSPVCATPTPTVIFARPAPTWSPGMLRPAIA